MSLQVGAGQSLQPLISFATNLLIQLAIPITSWANFPVFLKATAGLREMNDVVLRNEIMAQVRLFLQNCPFYFQWWQARVISGEEEGVYAWYVLSACLPA